MNLSQFVFVLLILSGGVLLSIGAGIIRDWLKFTFPKYYYLIGGIALIVGGTISLIIQNRKRTPSTIASSIIKVIKPLFDSSDRRFKIMVLPFDQECDYLGTNYDVGTVICKRLESLNSKDTLNLVTHYLTDSIDFANFNSKIADSIMKYHHADQIIYGSYSLKQCEGGTSDRICFNYRTDNKSEMRWPEKLSNDDYKMINISGLGDIRNGTGQENLDFIIYLLASFSAANQGEFDKGIRKLQLIKNFEKNSIALNTIGDYFYLKKNVLKAKEYYKKSLKIDSNNYLVWNNLGYLFLLSKEFVKSKKYLEKAVKIDSSFENAWHNLGYAYLLTNNFLKSKICLEKALKINPNNEITLYNIGKTYNALKDTMKERHSYEMALHINPYSPFILNSLGIYYLERNHPSSAWFYEKILQASPNNVIAFNHLGVYYFKLKNNTKALEYFKKATENDDNYLDAWLNLANVYDRLGRNIEMKDCLEKALSINSSSASVWFVFGNYYSNEKSYNKSINCYKKSLKITQSDNTWFNLGKIYNEINKFKEAKKCFEKAYAINPDDPEIWEMLGHINYFYLKNYEQAEDWYVKVIPHAKQKIELVYYYLANINSMRRNRTSTLYYIKQTIIAYPISKLIFWEEKNFSWLFIDQEFIELTE